MNFTNLWSDSQLVAHLSILAGECDINKEFLGPEPIKHRRNVCRVVVPFQAILSLVLHCQSEVFSETIILIITILGRMGNMFIGRQLSNTPQVTPGAHTTNWERGNTGRGALGRHRIGGGDLMGLCVITGCRDQLMGPGIWGEGATRLDWKYWGT